MTSMIKPLPLVHYSEHGLVVNDEAVTVLENIQSPVAIVGISGSYRGGKSYLANWFAENATGDDGFPLGSTVQSKTQGIWFYCRKHPKDQRTTVIILDTEGLDDPKKTDASSDLKLLTLTLLQSTVFILNATGKIDDASFKLLQYVAEVSQKVKANSNRDCGPESLKPYLPVFYLVLRDCFLEKVSNGTEITGDEYLEQCLELKPGTGRKVSEYNLPRTTIKACFEKRHCVFLHKPVNEESDLRQLGSIPTDRLRPDFCREISDLIRKVFSEERRFSVDGCVLDGRGWLSFLRKCLHIINNGGIPVLRQAYEAVIIEDNERTYWKAVKIYEGRMDKCLKTLIEADKLKVIHEDCKVKVLKFLRDNTKGNKSNTDMTNKLKVTIARKFDEYVKKNEQESRKYCRQLLEKLYANLITENIGKGNYTMPGGYDSYLSDQLTVRQLYDNEPNKGSAAEETVEKFFREKEGEALAICQADKNLFDKDDFMARGMKELEIHQRTPLDPGPEPSAVYPLCKDLSERAYDGYQLEMERKLQPDKPQEVDELSAAHAQAKTRALGTFDRDAIHLKGPVKNDIRQKLEGLMESMVDKYNDSNKTKSEKYCSQVLQNLFEEIDKKVKDGSYAAPGGHKSYLCDRKECEQLYNNEPSKGPAADQVLQRHLKNREEESRTIDEKDQKLLQEDRRHAESLHQEGLFSQYLGMGAGEK